MKKVITASSSNYLAHYGVSGQKWHVRRYQNEDGSYTAEGKARYGIGDGSENAKQTNNEQKDTSSNKERIKKVLKIAAGVTLAAVSAYAIYKGRKSLLSLRDRYRGLAANKSIMYYNNAQAETVMKNGSLNRAHQMDYLYKRNTRIVNDELRNGRRMDNLLRRLNSSDRNLLNERHKSVLAARDHARVAGDSMRLHKKYADIAKSGTARDALKNLIRNRGKLGFD